MSMQLDDYEIEGVRIKIRDDGRFEMEDWDDNMSSDDEDNVDGDEWPDDYD